MPWSHCGLEFILDDEACPTCGQGKGDWTIQVEKTRTFVIGRPRRDPPRGVKVDVALVTSFATLAEAQAWLLRSPLAAYVDGARVACGAYAAAPDRVVAQLRAPAGERDVVIASRARRPGVDVEAVLFAARLTIAAPPAGAGPSAGAGAGPAPAPRRAGPPRPRRARPAQPRPAPWLDLELRDMSGAPLAGRPWRVALADGRVLEGTLDGHGRARVEDPPAGECRVSFPGEELRRGRRLTSPSLAPSDRGALEGGRGRVVAQGTSRRRGVPARWSVAPEDPLAPVPFEPALVEAGQGKLVVFELAAKAPKVDVTLATSFATLSAAQAWLARSPLEAWVDGERVACGAYAAAPDRVVVQLRAATGERDVRIGTRTVRGGAEVRATLFARRLTIEERGSS